MARARNIKPGFFENEDLADCGLEAMLLFAGLWTLADREGRLEDRPRRIKAKLFAYFELDVDTALDILARKGFVQRYERNGNQFIQVTNFDKHQSPHVKEAASTLPAPDISGATPNVAQVGTVPAPPDSLIADSLRPESLIPELPAGERARERATPPPPTESPGPSLVASPGKTPLPRDWQPSDEDRAFARQFGMKDDELALAGELFKQHQWEHDNWSASWSASWRKWMVREVKGGPGAPRLPALQFEELPEPTEEERAAAAAQRVELERRRQEYSAGLPSAQERMMQKARDDPDRPDYVAPEVWMIWDTKTRRANSPAMRSRLSKGA